jgi:pimeloyl-ACP methyl ester carboxylesterase
MPAAVPIVYLPGGAGRSSFWRPVADRLWRQGAPVVLGYPGYGDVPPDPTIASLDGYFLALLGGLPARFHLVAQSMGSVLALRAAIDAPERIAGLVLCAPSGGVDVRALGAAEWRASFVEEHAALPTWFVDDRSDFTDRLHSIGARTLILSGDDDPLSPVAVGEFFRARIPGAELEVLARGGHWFALEQPDHVAERVGRFLLSATPSFP